MSGEEDNEGTFRYSVFAGKKPAVLISGCSTGIGEASAKLLAEKGWTVFAGVRKKEDAEKLQGYSDNIRPVILDVTKDDQIREAVEQVRVAVGEDGLDALVNNAGLMYTGPTEFISMDDVSRQFDVNVFGLVRLTQAAMPLIRMGTPGRIVNISSVATEMLAPYAGMYGATKAAMEAISYTMRMEVARWGIKVIVIKPGPVQTNFTPTAFNIRDEYMKRFTPGTPCYEHYGKDLDNFPKVSKKLESSLALPESSAKVIYTALTSRNPKRKYHDTWQSWMSVLMINWMPSFLYERLIGALIFAKD